MRITNNMVLRNSLAGLQTNKSAVQRLQTQITANVRIATASDDPAGAEQLMGADSSLGAIDQYKRNIQAATSKNAIEETAFGQVTDLLARAKELLTGQATDTASASTRQIAGREMEAIFSSVVALGNSKSGDTFLFGGTASTTPPFAATGAGATLDFTTTNPAGAQSVQVSAGMNLTPVHDGTEAFLTSGVLASLRDAAKALATNDVAGSRSALTALDQSFQQVQTLAGENGAKRNTLDTTAQNLDSLKITLSTFRSNLQDIDIEAAVTTLVTKQTAYQAAMAVTSKVLNLSLTDYLR